MVGALGPQTKIADFSKVIGILDSSVIKARYRSTIVSLVAYGTL